MIGLMGGLIGGGVRLMSRFPRIFAITQSRNMVIEEAYRDLNGSRDWLVNVTRNLNDWKICEYEALLQLLDSQ